MADQPAIGDVLKDITADIQTIVRGELELAKAEVLPGVKKAGMGAGVLGAAAVVGLIGFNVLFVCVGFAYSALFWGHTGTPVGAFAFGFLCAAASYLIVAGVLAVIGIVLVKKVRSPKQAVAAAEQSFAAVDKAVTAGLNNVKIIGTRGRKQIARDETGKVITVFAGPKHIDETPS